MRALQPEVEAEAEATLQCSAHFINAISVSARLKSAEEDRERGKEREGDRWHRRGWHVNLSFNSRCDKARCVGCE